MQNGCENVNKKCVGKRVYCVLCTFLLYTYRCSCPIALRQSEQKKLKKGKEAVSAHRKNIKQKPNEIIFIFSHFDFIDAITVKLC